MTIASSIDDFVAAALLDPSTLLSKFTIADLERFTTQDVSTVRWAYAKVSASAEGDQNA